MKCKKTLLDYKKKKAQHEVLKFSFQSIIANNNVWLARI